MRRPGFFAAVVLTLALGIGANSAIFSVINTVLLKPLPYPGGDRLMAVFESNPRQKAVYGSVAPVRLEEWNRANGSFTGITGAYTESLPETSGALPEKLMSARVANRFFSVLGTPLLAGRGFTADEERAVGPQAAVISERLWERRFARDPGVIGKTLRSALATYPIVGVAPGTFGFPVDDVDVWLPAKLNDAVMRNREARFYTAVGRLKEGVAPAAAGADLAAVQGRLAADFPASDAHWNALVEPLKERTVGGVRRSLWILFGAVSLVLLIACTNVACLMLAQASRREREIAVRFSLGAERSRVVKQLVLQALCAALPGAALGLVVAVAGARAFRSAAAGLPRAGEIHLDWRIAAFTLAVTLVTAILFGLVPALSATRAAMAGALAHGGRTQVGGKQPLLRALVSAQIALAIVLLVGSGLLIRTLARLGAGTLGFDPDRVLTLHISASWGEKNDTIQVERRLHRTLEAMRAIPGVEDAAVAVSLPGTGEDYPAEVSIAGRAPGPKSFADLQAVSPEYFRVMRIPLVAGETCTFSFERNRTSSVIVNRTFADRFLPDENPVGRLVKLTYGTVQIVAVSADTREHGYAHDPAPTVYSCGFPGFFPDPAFLIKTAGDPARMLEAVRRRVQSLEPARAVYDARPLTTALDSTLDEKRFQTRLLALFGATALALAMVGLYGVMSFFVTQRSREMGLRAALGARPSQILAHVFRHGAHMAAAGVLPGVAAAAALSRFMQTLLFGVTPWDPLAFAAAPLLLAAVAALAVWIPARRATRVDPMIALREE